MEFKKDCNKKKKNKLKNGREEEWKEERGWEIINKNRENGRFKIGNKEIWEGRYWIN